MKSAFGSLFKGFGIWLINWSQHKCQVDLMDVKYTKIDRNTKIQSCLSLYVHVCVQCISACGYVQCKHVLLLLSYGEKLNRSSEGHFKKSWLKAFQAMTYVRTYVCLASRMHRRDRSRTEFKSCGAHEKPEHKYWSKCWNIQVESKLMESRCRQVGWVAKFIERSW